MSEDKFLAWLQRELNRIHQRQHEYGYYDRAWMAVEGSEDALDIVIDAYQKFMAGDVEGLMALIVIDDVPWEIKMSSTKNSQIVANEDVAKGDE